MLASTANGCITEIGFGQLCQRLKDSEQEILSLRAACDTLRTENQRLVGELQSSTNSNLLAENQKIREQYQKLRSDYLYGSERHKEVCANYEEVTDRYRNLKNERDNIQREKDTLQREVHILRNTRSLSADQQYLLLEMKYIKVLELLKAQAVEGSRAANGTHREPPMASLQPMVRASGLTQQSEY